MYITDSLFYNNLVEYPSRFGYPDGAIIYADKGINYFYVINSTFHDNVARSG